MCDSFVTRSPSHLLCEQFEAMGKRAQAKMSKLEKDNSGMFGLIGALSSAGSAGGKLGDMIADSMSQATSAR